MRLRQPLLLMGAGDKGLGDLLSELFLQGLMLGEGRGWWGRRGSTFVLKGSEQGLAQCYQPGTDPAALLHLPAPLLYAGATSCPTPPLPQGDRTDCTRGSSHQRVILNPRLFIQAAEKGQQLLVVATDVQLERPRLTLSEGGRWVFPPCLVSAVDFRCLEVFSVVL